MAAILTASVGILAYFRLIPGSELFLYEGRASGTFKDANVFGPFLVPVALYLFSKLTGTPRRHIWRQLFLFLLIIFGILLSFSRGAWANLIISMFIYILLRLVLRPSLAEVLRLGFLSGIVSLITVALVTWAIFTPELNELFLERAKLLQTYDVEYGGRFSSLFVALDKSFEYPLGVGPGLSSSILSTEAHDLYIQVLIETGWLGLISFSTFIIYSLVRSIRFCFSRPEVGDSYIVIVASFIGLLLESLVIHNIHWRHLYLLLAMLWGPMLYYTKMKTTKI
ncbi:MAG: O-antigen ligase family protein [Thiohalomonadales bacterium]